MANGTLTLLSDDSGWESRINYSSTVNADLGTSVLTLTYQVRRIDQDPNSIGGNSSSYRVSGSVSSTYGATNGSILYNTSGNIYVPNSQAWVTITTTSHTITHASDGTASVTITCRIKGIINGLNFTEDRAVITLDQIIKWPYLTGADNFNNKDNPTITYRNPMGNSVTTLWACISFTGELADVPYRSVSKTGTSYTFNLTDVERETLIRGTSGASRSVRFILRAEINGETKYSVLHRTFSKTDLEPTLNPTVTDVNATTVALTGDSNTLIQYYSNAAITFGAEAKEGAIISSKKCVCGAKSLTNDGTITAVENGTFVFTATDNRGVTVSKTLNKTLIPYIKPTCNQQLRMVLENDNAAQVDLTITGNYFNGSFGAKNNTLTLYVRSLEEGGAWSQWGDISILINDISNNTYTAHANVSGLNPNRTYTFQCKAVDALGEAITTEYAVKLKPVFDWGKTDFNFNVPITIEGNPLVDFVIEEGTDAMGTNGTWYWRKWKSGRADCYGVRNYGNMGVSTAWGGLYRSESFSQSLPYGLFIATPEVVDITYRVANYGGWIARHEATEASKDNTGGFIVVRPASATLSQAHIGFNVIGRWKE